MESGDDQRSKVKYPTFAARVQDQLNKSIRSASRFPFQRPLISTCTGGILEYKHDGSLMIDAKPGTYRWKAARKCGINIMHVNLDQECQKDRQNFKRKQGFE